METIGILGLFFGLFGFLLSVYSVIKVKAWELSTHKIEYLHDGGYQETTKQAEEISRPPPQVFDNLQADDLDLDKSGL